MVTASRVKATRAVSPVARSKHQVATDTQHECPPHSTGVKHLAPRRRRAAKVVPEFDDLVGTQDVMIKPDRKFNNKPNKEIEQELLAEIRRMSGDESVLKTQIQGRRRRHSRERNEELARPKKHAGTIEAWGVHAMDAAEAKVVPSVQSERRLGADELKALFERLVPSKVPKATSSEESADQHAASSDQSHIQLSPHPSIDFKAVVHRLTTPRALYPLKPSGEALVLMSRPAPVQRSLDKTHMARLAKPSKRGSSCSSWGVPPIWRRPINTHDTDDKTDVDSDTSSD